MKYTVRKIMPRVTGAFFIAFLILSACSTFSSSVSSDEKEAFINTYTDMVLVQLKYDDRSIVLKNSEDALFQRNGLTKDEFLAIEAKVLSNPDLQLEIYNAILEQLRTYRELPKDSLETLIKGLTIVKEEK